MNHTLDIFLVNDTVRAVRGIYDPSDHEKSSRTYLFKTFDQTLKVDDLVVVPTDTRHGMTVFKIKEVDVDVDFDSDIEYKWVVGKVDKGAYEAVLAQETKIVAVIRSAEKTKKRDELRKALALDEETLKGITFPAQASLPAV